MSSTSAPIAMSHAHVLRPPDAGLHDPILPTRTADLKYRQTAGDATYLENPGQPAGSPSNLSLARLLGHLLFEPSPGNGSGRPGTGVETTIDVVVWPNTRN